MPASLRKLLAALHPRDPRLWEVLLGLGVAFRIWNVMFYRNPMNLVFSDAARHWDNAKHFLNPGPMGASNPYFYQLFLYLARLVTHENKVAMGTVAAALSILYPIIWYHLAARVMHRRVNALRFATVIAFLPTHVAMYSFFMNETLLFPLLGAAFLATLNAARRRAPGWFILAAALWVMAVLTRSVVMPIGGLAMLWAWWRQPRKVVTAVVALAFLAVGFIVPARRAYPVLQRYTPFGDNMNVAIYFYSGAHGYSVTYLKRARYGYGSPSLYISPFDPFYDFKSIRKGEFAFTIDPAKKGADVQKTLATVMEKNRDKLPRLIYENLIYLTFGHSWPDSAKEHFFGLVCLHERWIWFPIIVIAFYRSLLYVLRHGPAAIPMLTMLFTLSLYASQVALMEGRYRKPIEPLLLLALFWLAEARRPVPYWKRA